MATPRWQYCSANIPLFLARVGHRRGWVLLRYALLAALAIPLAASGRWWQGSAVVLDDGYRLEVVASSPQIGAVDGLFFHRGCLYVADEGGRAVFRRDAAGAWITLASAQNGLLSPESLVVDDRGHVYVGDDDTGGVWCVPSGEPARRLDTAPFELPSTEGLGLTPGGDLWIGDAANNRLLVVPHDGSALRAVAPAGLKKPEGLAVASDGRVLVADDQSGVVFCLHPDGTTSQMLGPRDDLGTPEAIAWWRDTLFVLDSAGSRLLRHRPETGLQCVAKFHGELKNVQGLAVADNGVVYISVQNDLQRNRGVILRMVPREIR